MNNECKRTLMIYLNALINSGFTAIHVSNVIPTIHPTDKKWSEFIDVDIDALPCGVMYDKTSGWFRYDKEYAKVIPIALLKIDKLNNAISGSIHDLPYFNSDQLTIRGHDGAKFTFVCKHSYDGVWVYACGDNISIKVDDNTALEGKVELHLFKRF